MAERDRNPVPVSGALIQAYTICPRQAWLLGHAIEPWRDHERLTLGRLLHATAYPRERHELSLPGMKIDFLRNEEEVLVAAEIKLSSRGLTSHKRQLGYYLLRLREEGLEAKGELRYPRERRVVEVALTPELEAEVKQALVELEKLLEKPKPPPPKRVPYCTSCAYYEFCWVGEE